MIYEAAGMAGDFASYLMRSLLSEGRIRYETVDKTTGGLCPPDRARGADRPPGDDHRGPPAPGERDEVVVHPVTDTPDQTRQVFRAIAAGGGEPVDLRALARPQAWLAGAEHRVTVYAAALAEAVPPVAVRLRRDFGLVLNLIRAHALLHQATRERDVEGRILATLGDYAVVRALVADLVAEGVEATVPATVRETVAAVKAARGQSDEPVSVARVAQRLQLDKGATSRRVRVALDRGYLRNDEPGRASRPGWCSASGCPKTSVLPSVAALAECCGVAGVQRGSTPLPPMDERGER